MIGTLTLAGAFLLTILSVSLIVLAIRGRATGDLPLCKRCGYDTTGLDGVSTCPECGADLLAKRAIRIGPRRKRWALLAWGVFVGLFPLNSVYTLALPLAIGYIHTFDVNRLRSSHSLEKQALASIGMSSVAFTELSRRLQAGTLDENVKQRLLAVLLASDLPSCPRGVLYFALDAWSMGAITPEQVAGLFDTWLKTPLKRWPAPWSLLTNNALKLGAFSDEQLDRAAEKWLAQLPSPMYFYMSPRLLEEAWAAGLLSEEERLVYLSRLVSLHIEYSPHLNAGVDIAVFFTPYFSTDGPIDMVVELVEATLDGEQLSFERIHQAAYEPEVVFGVSQLDHIVGRTLNLAWRVALIDKKTGEPLLPIVTDHASLKLLELMQQSGWNSKTLDYLAVVKEDYPPPDAEAPVTSAEHPF